MSGEQHASRRPSGFHARDVSLGIQVGGRGEMQLQGGRGGGERKVQAGEGGPGRGEAAVGNFTTWRPPALRSLKARPRDGGCACACPTGSAQAGPMHPSAWGLLVQLMLRACGAIMLAHTSAQPMHGMWLRCHVWLSTQDLPGHRDLDYKVCGAARGQRGPSPPRPTSPCVPGSAARSSRAHPHVPPRPRGAGCCRCTSTGTRGPGSPPQAESRCLDAMRGYRPDRG